MRTPVTREIVLPATEGPSKGDVAVTCSGPGRFCTGVPAQSVPLMSEHVLYSRFDLCTGYRLAGKAQDTWLPAMEVILSRDHRF